jgi:hypothetical protein
MPADGYQWDVFISYRRKSIVERWLPNFLHLLEEWLTEELAALGWTPLQPGAPARIFTDSKIPAGANWQTALREAVRTSRCAVTIWLPTYFQSAWCVAEWTSFRGRGNELVVPIRFHDGTSFPQEARVAQMFDFENYTSSAPAFRDTVKYVEFEGKVQEFARRLAQVVMAAPPFPNLQLPPNWVSPQLDVLDLTDVLAPPPTIPLARW